MRGMVRRPSYVDAPWWKCKTSVHGWGEKNLFLYHHSKHLHTCYSQVFKLTEGAYAAGERRDAVVVKDPASGHHVTSRWHGSQLCTASCSPGVGQRLQTTMATCMHGHVVSHHHCQACGNLQVMAEECGHVSQPSRHSVSIDRLMMELWFMCCVYCRASP